MVDLHQMLKETVEKKASDLHLAVGALPQFRLDGELVPLSNEKLTKEALDSVLDCLSNNLPADINLKKIKDYDFSYGLEGVARFRVNIFQQLRGSSVVFRTIPEKVATLESLGLPEVLQKFCQFKNGLVLVTGPTGSGKSTTLAAMIRYINEHAREHILTLEDPIEFVHEHAKSLVQQREVKQHTESFADALRAALREDPDVILVGEMRDIETIRLALTAAETGHLVFGTLHTSSAPKTINRIIDVFPAAEKAIVRSMLSESLQAVVAQVLLKKRGGGRVAAHEIMVCTSAVRNLIREDKVPQILTALQTGQAYGMTTMEQSIQKLKDEGLVD